LIPKPDRIGIGENKALRYRESEAVEL
jgi:hypothetical protein